MTNQLVGDVYAKIIEDVIKGSREEFENAGVGQIVLEELQQSWQAKLSNIGVAQMPWDPKPVPPAPQPQAAPPINGLPSSSYPTYDTPPATNNGRVKVEHNPEPQYNGLPNGYAQPPPPPPQGGLARAQQLVQQQYGTAASASLNAMQQRGGLALPGQQPQPRPQGLQLPGQPQQGGQMQYTPQQQVAMRQYQQQMQQQQQPRVKVETQSPQVQQGSFQPQPNYTQMDGADDAMEQWQEMLAQRRAAAAGQQQNADHFIRDQIMRQSADIQSGLMLPLNQLPSRGRSRKHRTAVPSSSSTTASPTIPQLDGEIGNDDEKADIKDEDDENAINSDLDDPDEDAANALGEDDDDSLDTIMCTYDKVQRVKNKWKCTLKDGIMTSTGKEWVFLKASGEFEW